MALPISPDKQWPLLVSAWVESLLTALIFCEGLCSAILVRMCRDHVMSELWDAFKSKCPKKDCGTYSCIIQNYSMYVCMYVCMYVYLQNCKCDGMVS